jgi:hypothetical protein
MSFAQASVYSGDAPTCRACGRMILADEGLRIDVVLELSPVAAASRATAKTRRRLDELSERGIDVMAISAEPP